MELENEFCPNERLANLKAESEEEFLECTIANIYIHPTIRLANDTVFMHNAENIITSKD